MNQWRDCKTCSNIRQTWTLDQASTIQHSQSDVCTRDSRTAIIRFNWTKICWLQLVRDCNSVSKADILASQLFIFRTEARTCMIQSNYIHQSIHPACQPSSTDSSVLHNHPQSSTLIICWIQRRSSGLDSCWEKSLWQLKYPDHDRYHQQAVWDHFMASSTWFQRVLLNLNCRSFSQILSERFF